MADESSDTGAPSVLSGERSDLEEGSLFGDYRIRRRLGSGGMGAVYEAEQKSDGRVVALKVLRVDLDHAEARDRFFREGRSAAAVNHPNTVYVYRTEEIDGVPVICMELVPDGTLEERVKAQGPLPVPDVVEFALDMIEGLAAAHDVGLLHRDIKPSNCFVAGDGSLKVGDFGLSKPVNADEQLRLTQTGVFLGTPVFSSPEQLLGESLDARSDIYAVGLTLYYALTGHLPYASGSMMQVVATVVSGVPTPLSTHRPDIPDDVTRVVMKAMARQPADRFQSYDEFREAVVGLRTPVQEPAALRDRVRAWLFDATLFLFLAISAESTIDRLRGIPAGAESTGVNLYHTAAYLLIALAVVGLPEGLYGTSLGKWLLGVRVAGTDGRVPGVTRASVRTMLLWSCYPIGDLVLALSGSEGISALGVLCARLTLLATARPENSWFTLYDRFSQTRVVRVAPAPTRRRRASAVFAPPSREQLDSPVGPYVALCDNTAGAGCVLAWDSVLMRYVWFTADPSKQSLSEPRRAVTRSTRLRFIGNGSEDGRPWCAFGAPGGEPFLSRTANVVRWDDAQGWLNDVADELVAAETDDSLQVVPPVDAIWIGANNGALIADVSPPAVEGEMPRSAPALVADMIRRLRSTGTLQKGLPAFIGRTLDSASTATSMAHVRDAMAHLDGRSIDVEPRRRVWMLVAQLAPLLFIPVAIPLKATYNASVDRTGAKIAALLDYMGSDTTGGSAPSEGVRQLGRGVRRLGFVATRPSLTAAQRDSLLRNRRLAGVYIGRVLAERARDTVQRSLLVLSERQQLRAQALEKTHLLTDSAEVRAAIVLVDSIWRGSPPGTVLIKDSFGVAVLLSIALGAFSALVGILVIGISRRGLIMRLFAVELVTADGRGASRLRALARHLMAVVPMMVAAVLCFVVLLGAIVSGEAPVRGQVCVGLVLTLWIGYLVHAVRSPARSIADRAAGTYLVPV